MGAHLLPRECISAVWHVLSLSSLVPFHFVIAFVASIGKSALFVDSETAQKITVRVRRSRVDQRIEERGMDHGFCRAIPSTEFTSLTISN